MVRGTWPPRVMVIAGLVGIFASRVTASTVYVDSTATGSGSGASWVNAYPDLQNAIQDAWGQVTSNPSLTVEIRVAQGRYKPDSGTNDQAMFFFLVHHVQIKGGYGGLQAVNHDERNVVAYETILTGDLGDDDVVCTFGSNNGDNSFNVVTAVEPDFSTLVDRTAVLDGVTITRANGAGLMLDFSGGSSPTINNCKISYNTGGSGSGGGIYCGNDCGALISNCIIEHNTAKFAGGMSVNRTSTLQVIGCSFIHNHSADQGGGIFLYNRAAPTIQACTFESNTSGAGGGMYIESSTVDTRPVISDCKFGSNEVTTNGGNGGGAIATNNIYPFVVLNCLFTGNKSHSTGAGAGGGAVLNYGGSTNQFVNCAFSRNTADGYGGAIYSNSTTASSTLTLVNCSFSNNSATSLGGGVCGGVFPGNVPSTTMTLRNCLFWGNSSTDSNDQDKQVSTYVVSGTTATYCSIQGCSGCFGSGNHNDNSGGSSPFLNPSMDNLRLKTSSPAIDAADNCQIASTVTTDLDGRTRRVNDSTSDTGADCGSGTTTYLDRGAYELNRSLDQCLALCLKGDVNHDGLVNGLDIEPMINRLLGPTACAYTDCEADMNSDSSVSLADVPCFVSVLLGMNSCVTTCTGGLTVTRGSADCNNNSVNDAEDIANGTSLDCNNNGIPDECDLDTDDPDGDGLVSSDVNANGIPDECEPDCNHNGQPDDWDISEYHSTDVNSNGIPDECEPDCNHNGYPDDYDIAMSTSADCNSNGIPDECEADCNSNGVPDDCDIASSYSQDCDGDGLPDECELAVGAMIHIFDCNDNGIPDNCDIASSYSLDENHNGIPDECEDLGGSSMMSQNTGESSNTQETGQTPEDLDAAWAEFYDWAATQCWGLSCETTGSEQFQAYLEESQLLGLPVEGLHSAP